MDEVEMHFVEPGDDAFKSVPFSPGEVNPHWVHRLSKCRAEDPDLAIARGFGEAADIVVDTLAGTNKCRHELFFPVGYLYRHSTELRLKTLIRDGVALNILKNDDAPLGSHSLSRLWKTARTVVAGLSHPIDDQDLQRVEAIVLQLDGADESGEGMRYAKSRKDQPYVNSLPMATSLAELKRVMQNLFGSLDAFSATLDSEKTRRGIKRPCLDLLAGQGIDP